MKVLPQDLNVQRENVCFSPSTWITHEGLCRFKCLWGSRVPPDSLHCKSTPKPNPRTLVLNSQEMPTKHNLIYFITRSLYLFTSSTHFAHTPPHFLCGNHQSVLCTYGLRFIFFCFFLDCTYKWNHTIHVDEFWGHYATWNKSDRGRQMSITNF